MSWFWQHGDISDVQVLPAHYLDENGKFIDGWMDENDEFIEAPFIS